MRVADKGNHGDQHVAVVVLQFVAEVRSDHARRLDLDVGTQALVGNPVPDQQLAALAVGIDAEQLAGRRGPVQQPEFLRHAHQQPFVADPVEGVGVVIASPVPSRLPAVPWRQRTLRPAKS
ncbi:hypothetical protein G6F55_013903 [Rhizopus delemar]|nr:hypothetical protein G6F22_019194 [Rhizopus arrhizus]KAG1247238.1 hypothetical protein G6F65_020273 [Rhizopus arrhizus]KAG1438637.1 hypothetical protein G6F55_013903 [Rhizopus delemar]